ncbi:MAG: ABC transporter permease [Vicinamibacterales bacterium]
MTDWRAHVRSRLPALDISAERETEIVEELALQLEAAYDAARAAGGGHEAGLAAAAGEVPDWDALARALERIERPVASRLPAAVRPPQQSPALGAGQGGPMTGLLQDLRYAVRALRKAPGFAALAVTTLALGIAATAIVYSLVDGILLRPLPFRDPDRLVLARETGNTGNGMSLSWPNFLDWRARATSFEAIGAWVGFPINLTGTDRPEQLASRRVTWNIFDVLGVRPALGRAFVETDDTPGAAPVAIISDRLWRTHFGGDPGVLGHQVRLDDVPTTIVGVLPPSFSINQPDDVFLPIGLLLTPGSYRLERVNHWGVSAIARLRPGVTVASARAEVEALAAQLAAEYPNTNSGNGAMLVPLHELITRDVRPMLLVLLASVGVLLLIGCANLANLMLARSAARGQEMAVRAALGAGRWRVIRQLLTESVLLAAAGGAAGLLLAVFGLRAVLAVLPATFPRLHLVTLNGRVLAAAAAVSLVTGILFGLVPALHAAGDRSTSLLRGARVSGAGGPRSFTRRLLLVGEIALAVVLLTGAGLMARTMARLLAVDPGVRTTNLLTAKFQLHGQRYGDDERLRAFYDRADPRVRQLPGVVDVSFAGALPVEDPTWSSVFVIEGRPEPPRAEVPSIILTPVADRYFETAGLPIVEGRPLGARDLAGSPFVAVVNRTFAERYFPGESAIGHRFKQGWTLDGGAPWIEIVGVSGDVKMSGLETPTIIQAYLSMRQFPQEDVAILVRTAGEPGALAGAMEAALHEVDPDLPLFAVRPMDVVVQEGVGSQRLTLLLLGGFAAMALVLAAVGVFGVTAYTVSQRTHEFGLRMALGADRPTVLRLVFAEGARVAGTGVVLGLAGAVALAGLMRSLVFEVAPRDPATLAATGAILLAVSLAACYLPARRATRVDPATALRME